MLDLFSVFRGPALLRSRDLLLRDGLERVLVLSGLADNGLLTMVCRMDGLAHRHCVWPTRLRRQWSYRLTTAVMQTVMVLAYLPDSGIRRVKGIAWRDPRLGGGTAAKTGSRGSKPRCEVEHDNGAVRPSVRKIEQNQQFGQSSARRTSQLCQKW